MDFDEFLLATANSKLLNSKYIPTLMAVFRKENHGKSILKCHEKFLTNQSSKTTENYLKEIYEFFLTKYPDLSFVEGKGQRKVLTDYFIKLYEKQENKDDKSDRLSHPTNLENIETTDCFKISTNQIEYKVLCQAWTVYEENIWVGRTEEYQKLSQKILSNCRIAIILGITGIGKTALAEKIADETRPVWDQIVRLNFDDDKVSESFLEAAKSLLKQFGISPTHEDYKKKDGLYDLLIYNVQSRQVLLIVDSLEFILTNNQECEQVFKDELWYKFFKCLLTTDSCKGRVILTSQVLPTVIEKITSRYSQYFYKSVMSGFTDLEQLELFTRSGLDITENSESQKYLMQMGKVYEGHPLSLRTIIGEIQEICCGNVLAYWEQYSEEFERVERDLIDLDSSGIDDQWRLHRLSFTIENKVQFRLQQTLLRLKKSCYSAYCLLCEASVFRGSRLERQWISQFKDRGDLLEELSHDGIYLALRKLYAWYLIESEVQYNKIYIRLHNLVRSIALEHLNKL